MPAWTNLSKSISNKNSDFGISLPGIQISVKTTVNQIIPGINFMKETCFAGCTIIKKIVDPKN